MEKKIHIINGIYLKLKTHHCNENAKTYCKSDIELIKNIMIDEEKYEYSNGINDYYTIEITPKDLEKDGKAILYMDDYSGRTDIAVIYWIPETWSWLIIPKYAIWKPHFELK